MKRDRTALGVFVAVAALVGAYHLGRARADGVPTVTPLFYGGMLEDNGRPVEGRRDLTIRLWDAASGGATACTTAAVNVEFAAGRFRVALDASCAGAVRSNPNLWAEVQIGGTTFPRSKLGAVPYALEAGRASGAAGALETRLAALEGRGSGGMVVHTSTWHPPDGGASEIRLYPLVDVLPIGSAVASLRPHPLSIDFVAQRENYLLPFLGSNAAGGSADCVDSSGASLSGGFSAFVYIDPLPVESSTVYYAGSTVSLVKLEIGRMYRLSADFRSTNPTALDRCRASALHLRVILARRWMISGF